MAVQYRVCERVADMRWGAFISLVVLGWGAGGCSGAARSSAAPNPPPVAQHAGDYDGAVAASLVYTPPVVAHGEQPDFSRDGRAVAAYAGFEDVITTQYFLYQDDRQLKWGGLNQDRFERQAITIRQGVSYR